LSGERGITGSIGDATRLAQIGLPMKAGVAMKSSISQGSISFVNSPETRVKRKKSKGEYENGHKTTVAGPGIFSPSEVLVFGRI
jgi:hypothetical protein